MAVVASSTYSAILPEAGKKLAMMTVTINASVKLSGIKRGRDIFRILTIHAKHRWGA